MALGHAHPLVFAPQIVAAMASGSSTAATATTVDDVNIGQIATVVTSIPSAPSAENASLSKASSETTALSIEYMTASSEGPSTFTVQMQMPKSNEQILASEHLLQLGTTA
jgi:hypothetical protein